MRYLLTAALLGAAPLAALHAQHDHQGGSGHDMPAAPGAVGIAAMPT